MNAQRPINIKRAWAHQQRHSLYGVVRVQCHRAGSMVCRKMPLGVEVYRTVNARGRVRYEFFLEG